MHVGRNDVTSFQTFPVRSRDFGQPPSVSQAGSRTALKGARGKESKGMEWREGLVERISPHLTWLNAALCLLLVWVSSGTVARVAWHAWRWVIWDTQGLRKEEGDERRVYSRRELRRYADGRQGRILIAVNGKVRDVSSRADIYGPGKSSDAYYSDQAGRTL